MIQRQFHRVNYRMPASISLAYGSGNVTRLSGEVCDISVSGLRLIVREGEIGSLSPGAKARIVLQKSSGSGGLDVAGTVVRSMGNTNGSHELAIRYDRVRYDVVASISTHHKILVELSPFGWTDYRMVVAGDR